MRLRQRGVEMWACLGEVRGSGHGVLASQLQYVYTAAYTPSIHGVHTAAGSTKK
jgi:hypothetical protein